MAHVAPGRLADLALGVAAGGDDPAALHHLAVCARCREELARLHRVVTAARSVEPLDLPAAPPERVWEEVLRVVAPPVRDAEADTPVRHKDTAADAPVAGADPGPVAHAPFAEAGAGTDADPGTDRGPRAPAGRPGGTRSALLASAGAVRERVRRFALGLAASAAAATGRRRGRRGA